MSYVILIPSVESANISPNPVNANTSYVISITMTEIQVELEPIIWYCGTFICGEEEVI